MAKKKKNFRESTIENYYDLKSDKVDELVAALKDEPLEANGDLSMFISDCTGVDDPENMTRSGKQREFDPYKIDKFSRIPVWLKAVLIKLWFAGMVCYFVMWGLYINSLDALVLTGGVLGLIVDVIVNPVFRYMESDRKEYNDYMMFPFPFRAFWTFFTNILYYVFVVIIVNYCYFGINLLCDMIAGTSGTIHVGVEPLLFGAICVVVDMVFIGIKDAIVRLIKKRKKESAVNV